MKKYKIFTIIILCLTIFLWVSFADGPNGVVVKVWNQVTSLAQDWFKLLQQLLGVLYLLIWPFLVLAGKLLSNAFVYWTSFFIDWVLWKLWQLVRTFMNYFIGIIFLVSIVIYFFKDNSKLSLRQIFPKIVLASIVVNASWFLLAALIDLSTILLVGAWWIGTKFNDIISKGTNRNPTQDCLVLPITVNTDKKSIVQVKWPNWKEYTFCIRDKNWKIQNSPCIVYEDGVYKLDNWEPVPWCLTAKDIDNSSVGMLFSIFRYMNTAFIFDNTNTDKATFWLFVIKSILMLALIIPFILLCIILVIRLMILWIVIPLSPILFWLPILWVFDSKVKEKLTSILALIFQPAYVVFMLSLGFVFIQSLYVMMPSVGGQENNKNFLKTLNIEKVNENELEIYGLLDIKTKYASNNGTNTDISDFKNLASYISWIILNLIWVMILWTLVFTAFKSNTFTKKIATAVDTTAKEWLKTLEILPGGQSIASMEKAADYLSKVPGQISTAQYNVLEKKIKENLDKFNK